jgi:hypothetical protein
MVDISRNPFGDKPGEDSEFVPIELVEEGPRHAPAVATIEDDREPAVEIVRVHRYFGKCRSRSIPAR